MSRDFREWQGQHTKNPWQPFPLCVTLDGSFLLVLDNTCTNNKQNQMATSAKSPVRQKNKDCSSESSNVQIGIVHKKKLKNFTQSWLLCLCLTFMNPQLPPTQKHTRLCKLIEFSLNLHDFFSKTGRQGCYCNTSQIQGTVSIQFNSKKPFSFSIRSFIHCR